MCSRHIDKYDHTNEWELIFWPNYSKSAVECAWSKKIPQNIRNWGVFWKNKMCLSKKTWFFKKSLSVANLLWNACQMALFLENFIAALIMTIFDKSSESLERGNVSLLEHLLKKEGFFSKKQVFSF